MAGELCWQCKKFNELSLKELHSLLLLRAQVFVVEQNCVYQDPDNDDLRSCHLLVKDGETLVAYLRIILPRNNEPFRIGRVVVVGNYRQYGLGRQLMERGIAHCREESSLAGVHISAQAHLLKFYKNLGFVEASEIYDEDGIDHIDMIYTV